MLRWLFAFALTFALALPALAQSRTGEMRGAWMGSGYGRDWPAIMKSLKDNGFNALFPNMCSGGAAFYPSKVLPQAAGATPGRDELAEAAKAAKQYGIELHVWRINWMLENAPPEVLARYEAEGRLMRNPEGKLVRDDPQDSLKLDWLCPSNPANRKLEKDAMLELVRRYDIAGIQFDYMRYPSPNYCFCDHCKEQFQKDTGITVEHWPADVTGDGKYAARYADWRRGLETSLVAEISQEAHHIKPGIFVSLAAWPDPEVARNWVLQDWPAWVAAGSLDFICFMDYTTDNEQLVRRLAAHRDTIHGSIPVYAGLGSFLMKDASTLGQQIEITRREGADGFLAFAYYSGDLNKWLPTLHETVTAADPNPMPHGGPGAVFQFSGPATARPAAEGQVLAGKELVAEVTVGTPASQPGEEESEGAAQAASVLQRASEARPPVASYEPTPAGGVGMESRPRLSGRMVAEAPDGATLANLGVFDADFGIKRSLRFLAPEGPFRVAVYGAASEGGERKQDFVVRAPLLVGIQASAGPDSAQATHADLQAMLSGACARADAAELAGLTAALQLHYTGPGGGDWSLAVKNGACQLSEGTVEKPDATITLSVEDALAALQGQSDPVSLWDSGRVVVTGNLLLVQKIMAALGYHAGE
jgi:uncharacterized lipoprotein YddW (UPF0748 family)/putative sterol carrier protein